MDAPEPEMSGVRSLVGESSRYISRAGLSCSMTFSCSVVMPKPSRPRMKMRMPSIEFTWSTWPKSLPMIREGKLSSRRGALNHAPANGGGFSVLYIDLIGPAFDSLKVLVEPFEDRF